MNVDEYLLAMVSRARLAELRLLDQQTETAKAQLEAIEAARQYVSHLRLVPASAMEGCNASYRQG